MKMVLVSYNDGSFLCFNCDELVFCNYTLDLLLGGKSITEISLKDIYSIKIIR